MMARFDDWYDYINPLEYGGAVKDKVIGNNGDERFDNWYDYSNPYEYLGAGVDAANNAIFGPAERAANAQTEGARQAMGFLEEGRDYQREVNQPYLEGGTDYYLNEFMPGMNQGKYDMDVPQFDPSQYDTAPQMYQSQMQSPERFQSQMGRPEMFQGTAPNASRYSSGITPQMYQDNVPEAQRYNNTVPDPQRYQQAPWSLESLAQDPGYQFRKQQGNEAIEGMAASRGGRLSGNTLKELTEFGSGLASQEADKAYGRYADQRGFGYGAERDYRGDVERQGDVDYRSSRDYRGDVERQGDRGRGDFLDYQSALERGENRDWNYNRGERQDQQQDQANKYRYSRDYIGDQESREGRDFLYNNDYWNKGMQYDNASRQDFNNYQADRRGDTMFRYQADQDYLRNQSANLGNMYNRDAATANSGQTSAQNLGAQGMNAASQMSNAATDIGAARANRMAAPMNSIQNLLQLGGQGLDASMMIKLLGM